MPRASDETTAAPFERPAHEELYLSTRTATIIRVSCSCEIDRDHTYADWRDLASTKADGRHATPQHVGRVTVDAAHGESRA